MLKYRSDQDYFFDLTTYSGQALQNGAEPREVSSVPRTTVWSPEALKKELRSTARLFAAPQPPGRPAGRDCRGWASEELCSCLLPATGSRSSFLASFPSHVHPAARRGCRETFSEELPVELSALELKSNRSLTPSPSRLWLIIFPLESTARCRAGKPCQMVCAHTESWNKWVTAQKLTDKRKSKDANQAFNQRTCCKIKHRIFNPLTSTAVWRAETLPRARGWDKRPGATLHQGLFGGTLPVEGRGSTGTEKGNEMFQSLALGLSDPPVASSRSLHPI